MGRPVAFATDHAGADVRSALLEALRESGCVVLEVGTSPDQPADDYPDVAKALAAAVVNGQAECGILLCGSGVGVSIAANRVPGIRAALCHDTTTAHLARLHNDANVLCLGARTMGLVTMIEVMQTFLDTAFSGAERHKRRIGQLG